MLSNEKHAKKNRFWQSAEFYWTQQKVLGSLLETLILTNIRLMYKSATDMASELQGQIRRGNSSPFISLDFISCIIYSVQWW